MVRNAMSSNRQHCSIKTRKPRCTLRNLCNEAFLGKCLREVVQKGQTAVGVDGMQIGTLKKPENRRTWVSRMIRQLKTGTYRPKPVMTVRIPKPGRPGEFRTLGIPTLEDRVIARAMAQLLQRDLDPSFANGSYGFRQSRNVQHCIQDITTTIRELRTTHPQLQFIRTDIACLFDSLSHERLYRLLGQRIQDREMYRLIRAFLRAGKSIKGRPVKSRTGTPQGLPLSPILANLYLDDLDKSIHSLQGTGDDENSQQRTSGRLKSFRYVDDLLIIIPGTEDEAHEWLSLLENHLVAHFHLKLAETKTKISGNGLPFMFLGFLIHESEDGTKVLTPDSAVEAILTSIGKQRLSTQRLGWEPIPTTRRVQEMLSGWLNHYRWTDDFHDVLSKLKEGLIPMDPHGTLQETIDRIVHDDACKGGRAASRSGPSVRIDSQTQPRPAAQ